MAKTKPKKQPAPQAPTMINVKDPASPPGTFKLLGGSRSDTWNLQLVNQVISTLWLHYSDEEGRKDRRNGAIDAFVGIGPKDELEGMIAAQLLASHNAAMECYRRAMIGDQTFEGRQENLNQASKLSRTYVTLLEALNRHRGKGQQKVTVEHVHVHKGGQAIVGTVESPRGRDQSKSKDQLDASQIAHAPQPTVWSTNTPQAPLPVAGDEEWPLPDARRNVPGSAEGK